MKLILFISLLVLPSIWVQDKPSVLIIGDSISKGYGPTVIEKLKSEATVVVPDANCGSTRIGLRDLEKWLGDTRWDVIHFNFGLHDLGFRFDNDTNRNEKGEYATPFNGGHQNVSLGEYQRNLKMLCTSLKRTGARLIFATTTPVSADLHSYIKDSEIPYNEVALKVMREEGIPVNDLWRFSKPIIESLQIPGDPHFTSKGSKVLGEEVARSIRGVLND